MQTNLIRDREGIIHGNVFSYTMIGYGNICPEIVIFVILINRDQGIQGIISAMKLNKYQYIIISRCQYSSSVFALPASARKGTPLKIMDPAEARLIFRINFLRFIISSG